MATYYKPIPQWLWIKLGFVAALYIYHFTLQRIYKEEMKAVFRFNSNQLRVWNEVATILLIAIVMVVTVKENMSWFWGITGLLLFAGILMSAIKIYKLMRNRK